jgi:hypothetical protein
LKLNLLRKKIIQPFYSTYFSVSFIFRRGMGLKDFIYFFFQFRIYLREVFRLCQIFWFFSLWHKYPMWQPDILTFSPFVLKTLKSVENICVWVRVCLSMHTSVCVWVCFSMCVSECMCVCLCECEWVFQLFQLTSQTLTKCFSLYYCEWNVEKAYQNQWPSFKLTF